MERRFALFLTLSFLILFTHLLVQNWLAPPQPVAQQEPAEAGQEPLKAEAVAGTDEKPKEPAGKEETPTEVEKEKPAEQIAPVRAIPPQHVTLGSLQPGSPFRLLVTLNNRGAAVERIELTERNDVGVFRYRDLETNAGYLGQLALSQDPSVNGCKIQVVGDGTPAAEAQPVSGVAEPGLRAGDVVQRLDDRAIRDAYDFEECLQRTRPGQTIQVQVARPGASSAAPAVFRVVLMHQPLSIVRPETNPDSKLAVPDPLSFLLSLETVGSKSVERGQTEIGHLPSLHDAHWEVKLSPPGQEEPAVEFRLRLEARELTEIGAQGPLEIVKRYRLARTPADQLANPNHASYHLTLEIEIHNLSKAAQPIAYRLDGANGLPLEGWWYSTKIHTQWFAAAGARDIVWKTPRTGYGLMGCAAIYDDAKKAEDVKKPVAGVALFPPDGKSQPLDFIGVDTQYFVVAALPVSGADGATPNFRDALAIPAGDVGTKDKKRIRTSNVSFRLISQPRSVPAGQALRQSYTVFAGPKLPALLEPYHLERCVEYGWFPWIARPLSGLLHFFESLPLVNWGLAIILLTVLVRLCMVPISRKAAKNSQVMAELSPELKRIAEKHKDDLQKQMIARRELFAKHNYSEFSMFGGCLLLFLQLPIFIGLYRSLSTDVALRQSSLIPGLHWCSNLAGPDMLWYWKPYLPGIITDEANGFLGPYFNILPIITIILFIVQQKMFMPPPTDEQMRMQQKMMNIMMVVMGFMFFCVPSGLCVYFIASSLWGLAERKLLPPVGKKKDVGLPKERSVWMQRLLGAEPRKRRPKRRGK